MADDIQKEAKREKKKVNLTWSEETKSRRGKFLYLSIYIKRVALSVTAIEIGVTMKLDEKNYTKRVLFLQVLEQVNNKSTVLCHVLENII